MVYTLVDKFDSDVKEVKGLVTWVQKDQNGMPLAFSEEFGDVLAKVMNRRQPGRYKVVKVSPMGSLVYNLKDSYEDIKSCLF